MELAAGNLDEVGRDLGGRSRRSASRARANESRDGDESMSALLHEVDYSVPGEEAAGICHSLVPGPEAVRKADPSLRLPHFVGSQACSAQDDIGQYPDRGAAECRWLRSPRIHITLFSE